MQVYDVGDADGRPYFTMEFMEGGSLAQKLTGIPQPARQPAQLLATLTEAVQAAHQSGIVHRDLKPGNVLLTADGTPKISDFGLARRLDAEGGLTRIGIPLGTPSYMAPEQARGKNHAVGPATDVYALGAILYELLTGRPPFLGETAAETARQEQALDTALEKAATLGEQGRWPEARTVLMSMSAPAHLRERLDQARADANMAANLEGIRVRLSAETTKTRETADPLYAEAFRNYGIDLNPAEAAARIRDSAILR